MTAHPLIGALSFAAFIFGATATLAADPAAKCESAKLKEVAKYASCRLKAEAKGVQTNMTPDFSVCAGKFTAKFPTLDTKFGTGVCPTEGDEASVNARITGDTDTLASLLSGARYVDNGNGTVTDLATGLIWQKTDDAGGLTDKDNTYTWTLASPGTAPTGSAFTVFLAGLNGTDDGTCFANQCDWRLPTIEELQTILLEPSPCASNPCIDQAVFGPQNVGLPNYWSSTTNSSPGLFGDALMVYFNGGGGTSSFPKYFPLSVRAVRGGS